MLLFNRSSSSSDNDLASIELNALFSKISDKEPYEKTTPLAVKKKLLELYTKSNEVYLEISLPNFGAPVIYDETSHSSQFEDISYPSYLMSDYINTFVSPNSELKKKQLSKPITQSRKIDLRKCRVVRFHDPSIMKKQHLSNSSEARSNPVADLYYFLTRTGDDLNAEKLTPDKDDHHELMDIIKTPDFTSLKPHQKNLLWKFRYSIKRDENYQKGLVKFLKSVNWNAYKEANEALEMLKDWKIELEQA